VEVKPSEATICGFAPLVEARRSFMDSFKREAKSKNNRLAQLHVKLPKKLPVKLCQTGPRLAAHVHMATSI
jgi:hypothetical protein